MKYFKTLFYFKNPLLHEWQQSKIKKSIILESRLKSRDFFTKSTCNRLFFKTKSIIQKVLVQASDCRTLRALLADLALFPIYNTSPGLLPAGLTTSRPGCYSRCYRCKKKQNKSKPKIYCYKLWLHNHQSATNRRNGHNVLNGHYRQGLVQGVVGCEPQFV